ncbi:MAG: thioredoxin-disulfide reductase [Actinomycetota bacterium]|nr:thioredoxin-disulfide reductase [Actinomycetota bacterium]
MADKTYDLIIIGGGPGGLTAAIYALRAKLDLLLIEKTGIGGQIALSDVVENYPGTAPISGVELMAKFEEQAKAFGLEIEYTEVQGVRDGGDHRVVSTTAGELRTKAVIIASGAKPRRLDVPGEVEYTGRGVSYCATCDGFFFRGKDVVVVGGGDTAVKEALFLAKMVNKIELVHRRDALRAEKIIQEKALNDPKIEFHWDSVVTEVTGDKTVSGVTVKNVKTDAVMELAVAGVFVFVGILPNSDFVDCDKDEAGFIKTDEHMRTSIPGVFAAGDVRTTVLRQVATAVGDGAIAAYAAGEFLANL